MAEFEPIQPQPMPTKYAIGRVVAADGTQLIQLVFSTPSGQFVIFLDAGSAESFGMQVANEGRKSRLAVAPPGQTLLSMETGHPSSDA